MNGVIQEAWKQLAAVRTLSFRATSAAAMQTGWVGDGKGVVAVETPDAWTLIFRESGSWTTPQGKEVAFHNTYRWKLDDSGIRLEHLRFGPDTPVFLFALEAVAPRKLASSCPHVCAEDRYRAVMELGEPLRLCWTIKGPAMDETIDYQYDGEQAKAPDRPRDEG
jgi:hypothetical protein